MNQCKNFPVAYAPFTKEQGFELVRILMKEKLIIDQTDPLYVFSDLFRGIAHGIRICAKSLRYSTLYTNDEEYSYESCMVNLVQATEEEKRILMEGTDYGHGMHTSINSSNFLFGMKDNKPVVYDFGYQYRREILGYAGIYFPEGDKKVVTATPYSHLFPEPKGLNVEINVKFPPFIRGVAPTVRGGEFNGILKTGHLWWMEDKKVQENNKEHLHGLRNYIRAMTGMGSTS